MPSISHLDETPEIKIIDCLHLAFSDYKLNMKMPYEYWINRWLMAKIDYSLSYGFFEGSELVGFILHGIDTYKDKKSFYNMATGVIPEFRGQRIVKKLYTQALPELKSASCELGCLEVLSDNTKAIKAYESMGFRISDLLHSYRLPKKIDPIPVSLKFQAAHPPKSEVYTKYMHHLLSFEHRNSIIEGQPEAVDTFELYSDNTLLGFAVIKKANSALIQFGIMNNELNSYAIPLFSAISQLYPACKIININDKDTELVKFFNENGFDLFISQYAMQLDL